MQLKRYFFGGTLALAASLAGCNSNVSSPPVTRPTTAPSTLPTNPPVPAGSYTQIERLSRPAVKELFEVFVDHQTSNAVEPYNDPTLQSSITAFSGTFRNAATANALTSILYPDEETVDLSQSGKASYLGVETGGATGGKFGGRDLGDNVIDISLGAVFGNTLSALGVVPDDGQENTCLTTQHVSQNPSQANTSTFPYLATPH
jgi:hypothetical protein